MVTFLGRKSNQKGTRSNKKGRKQVTKKGKSKRGHIFGRGACVHT